MLPYSRANKVLGLCRSLERRKGVKQSSVVADVGADQLVLTVRSSEDAHPPEASHIEIRLTLVQGPCEIHSILAY